jgi:hypothetical protein
MVQVFEQQPSSHCLVVHLVRFRIFYQQIPRLNLLFALLYLLLLVLHHPTVETRMVAVSDRVVCAYELVCAVGNYSLQSARRPMHIRRMCETIMMSHALLRLSSSDRCPIRRPSR